MNHAMAERETITGDSSNFACELHPLGLTPSYLAMADGDATPIWPGPVTFNDDDPKKGFASVYLSVPNLSVKKGVLGKAKPKEGTLVDPCFDDGIIKVKVTTTVNGTEQIYEYKKNAVEDIDPQRCEILYKDKRVIVKLAKVAAKSWAAHARYFIERPE